MAPTLRYVLILARRDRLFLGLALAIALAAALAAALGSAAIVEGRELALVFAAAAIRIVLAVGLVAFVLFSLARLFDSHEAMLILSRPLTRARFVIAVWSGYAAAALALVLPAVAAVWLVGPPPAAGLALWAVSLFLEASLLVAAALFFGLVLTSPVAATVAVLGFYVLARMMRSLVAILDSEWAGSAGPVGAVVEGVLVVLSVLLPRLDLFARSDWLVHGGTLDRGVLLAAAQWLVYLPFLLAAAAFDFRRREF
jgi:hypothetical protein